MPLITRPTIVVNEIKNGDRLLFTDALDEDSNVPAMPLIEGREYPQKGKHKGLVLVKVKGKADPIPLDPTTKIIVERNVATQQERDAYMTAWERWWNLSQIVEAQRRYLDALSSMRSLVERLAEGGIHEINTTFGGGVTRHAASDLDSAAGVLRATWEAHAETARREGWTYDFMLDLARNHHAMGKGQGIHHFQPEPPLNADCFEDGVSAGSNYRCVRLSRAEEEARQDEKAEHPEPAPLLVDRYAARQKKSA